MNFSYVLNLSVSRPVIIFLSLSNCSFSDLAGTLSSSTLSTITSLVACPEANGFPTVLARPVARTGAWGARTP